MQYILTQQEYEALRLERRRRTEKETATLQALCTLAAQHIPVSVEWRSGPPKPWGCILGPSEQDPSYCDECPARDVCPNDGKEWSQ